MTDDLTEEEIHSLVAGGGTVRDYCLSYTCHPEERAWAVTAWACVCFGHSAIAAVDQLIDSDLRRCHSDQKLGNTVTFRFSPSLRKVLPGYVAVPL